MIGKTRLASLTALLVAVVVSSSPAQAQNKPFWITGEGVAPRGLPLPGQEPRPHFILGYGTYLGRHYGEGTVRTDSAVLQSNGTITGEFGSGSPFFFYGSAGDVLVCYYGRTDHGASEPGRFVLTIQNILEDGSLVVEALWIAEFVPVPDLSTGRFAGVTGSWIMYAKSAPFILGSSNLALYSWEGEGWLNFPPKK